MNFIETYFVTKKLSYYKFNNYGKTDDSKILVASNCLSRSPQYRLQQQYINVIGQK
jgi:hypothetical protein